VSRGVGDVYKRDAGTRAPAAAEPGLGGLREAVSRLIEAVPGPVVLCLDDLHWADEATLRWLASHLRREPSRVKALLAVRNDEPLGAAGELLARLEREGRLARLSLGPLSPPASAGIVAELLGRPEPELARRLHAQSGGNPLYLTELLRVVRERPAGDAAAGPEALPLPSTVLAAMRERIARLPVSAAALAEAAAVFPEPEPLSVVAEVADLPEARALAALDALLEAHILREEGEAPPRLSFRHPLLRRAIRAGCSESRWVALNQRAFRCLAAAEAREPDGRSRAHGRLEALARTATEGCLWEEGLRASLAAAERAEESQAAGLVLRLLEQALRNLRALPPTSEREELAADLHLRLWEASLAGAPDAADRYAALAARAISRTPRKGDAAFVSARASTFLLRGRLRQAAGALARLAQAAEHKAPPRLRALAHMRLGQIYALQGHFRKARSELAASLRLFGRETAGDVPYGARSALAAVVGSTGRFEEAFRLLDAILAAQGTQSAAGLYALLQIGTMAHMRGDWRRALSALRRVLALARRRGEPSFVYLARLFLALPLGRLADPEAGARAQSEAIALGERVGVGLLADRGHAWLAELLWEAGDREGAVQAARRGLAIARRDAAPFGEALNLRWLGRAAVEGGSARAGLERLSESRRIFVAIGALPEVARGEAALAAALLRSGDPSAAARRARRAGALFARLGMRWDLDRLAAVPDFAPLVPDGRLAVPPAGREAGSPPGEARAGGLGLA
ncbi:MAG: hypothetical protein IRZ11_08935, partial [Clostridia bacterium]|nr:hypothetical protein [Clostridia bacterium]